MASIKTNPDVLAIYEFGEIKYPGLSDIDWLVVLNSDIKSSANLMPSDKMSDNLHNAFQHRPIFHPVNELKTITEFVLPSSEQLVYGEDLELFKGNSIDKNMRDLTLAYDFFVRQKNWIKRSVFDKLTLRKKIALFVSISKHSMNNLFSENELLSHYEDQVDNLRKSVVASSYTEYDIYNVRKSAIDALLLIESIMLDCIKKKGYTCNGNFKYKGSIKLTNVPEYSDDTDLLSKDFLYFYEGYSSELNKSRLDKAPGFEYMNYKYKSIYEIAQLLRSIDLRSGLVNDLNQDNWFPMTPRYALYRAKKKLQSIFFQ